MTAVAHRSPAPTSETRVQRWQRLAEWPLAACAAVFLVLFSVKVLAQPQGVNRTIIHGMLFVLYLPFLIDYLARLLLAQHRARWFFRHLLDLVVVVVPVMGPLLLLRLVALVAALQRAVGDAIRGRVVVYTAFSAVLLVYSASLAVLQVERPAPGANITNFGDAVWWSVATITTVGYGDLYPVTVLGRVVAALLMIGGISLVGAITATIASWIVQRVAAVDNAQQAATVAHIESLQAEVSRLADLVSARQNTEGRST
ncbi:potassium channel family protein [Mycobacterium sp. shizuoka-1]|uniref:potassium channel family protein n=1 Tax=Mycobacterium sp. shizuoka-1 TaxID=2039281 RepID=UPI000C062A6E|nr:potassium channel family protein [Mycobacterium sp. shizuoka-1]GAY16829.1 voltage-gated potassium channel [Mycobacterium sp. shizuoka-1]